MSIENGEYRQLTDDQIQNAIESELQVEFGQDIDLTESSVFTKLADLLGTVLSENQEKSISEVYNSAFIETATGRDLERVVALLGLQRRNAIRATGVERFTSNNKVEEDFIIQRGTEVQTAGTDPVTFETSEVTTLELVNDFEDGDLTEFSGDTASASIVSTNVYNGSNALQLDATAGAHIYDESINIGQGTTLHGHARPTAGTVPILTFAVQEDASNYYQIAFDEAVNEVRIERVDNGSVASTIDTASVTLNADAYYEAELDWNITDNIGVTVKDANGSELTTLGGEDGTYQRGAAGFKSGDANGTKNLDFYTMSATSANIRAVEGGPDSNLGANTLTALPSPPAGVNTVTNLYPTGSTDFTDREGNQFRVGQEEETDAALRDRAVDVTTGGGSATHDAIVGNIRNSIPEVTSVTMFENKTDSDNTGTGGLPPHSFEAVVFGGTDQQVAEALFEKKAVTARDYSGVNGTSVTETVVSDTNDQERQIEFSRPTAVNIDMTLDLVINGSYIGNDPLRDKITRYIGGTESSGAETIGLQVGKDVIIDVLRDIIVGDDTGVIAFDKAVDGAPLETTPTSTTVDGIEVIQIDPIEVAQTDATDTSITINTRQQ